MYAAHFAAGLAIKSRAAKAPTLALLIGVFLPDLVWIVLAALGLEPTGRDVFFDDWSHSLLTITLQATLFAALFWRRGAAVTLPLWLAVFSHFLLDLPIHPRPLALYPHSAIHLSLGFSDAGRMTYWWVQLAVVAALLPLYALGAHRRRMPANLIAASVLLVLSLHLLML